MSGRYEGYKSGGDGDADDEIPAVAYVRMSTDHQKYSTENQLDVIRDYATARGLKILRVFEDSGRSGLRLDGREALQSLMAEVATGQADFKAILVYDVSRWGRFQDADEGAYHEHVCSRAGIPVHYCGELQHNGQHNGHAGQACRSLTGRGLAAGNRRSSRKGRANGARGAVRHYPKRRNRDSAAGGLNEGAS